MVKIIFLPWHSILYTVVMDKFGSTYQPFGHGVLHGVIVEVLFTLPVLVTNALFERKGFKYMAINAGYWILCIAIKGGIICEFTA